MNLYPYKVKIIGLILSSFSLMAGAYGDFSEDACFKMPDRTCGKFAFEVDFLILRPYEKISDPCALNQVAHTVNTDGTVLTTLKNINNCSNFKWQPAFRITAGYTKEECNWKSNISWTHFNSRSHIGQENRRKWGLNFDTLDAIFGYTFYANNCFSITSFGGIRGAKIDQNIHLITVFDNPIQNKNRQKFWGVGPILGFEANYKIKCNFSFYANIDIAWLYGKHNIRQNNQTTFDTGITNFHLRKNFIANQFVTDAGIGIQWDTVLCNHKMFFRLGLEHHQYFDYNYFQNSALALSGGTLSAGFEF